MYGFIPLLALAGCDGAEKAEAAAVPEEAPVEQASFSMGLDDNVCDGQCEPLKIDHFRSLVVSDPEILARFELRRVLDQIISFAGASNTADDLWRQWWSSQRLRTAGDPAHHPFCDDNGATINGFPIQCPRNESKFEGFDIESHRPIALVNRFDLAPMDGAHCGEYRIVYALNGEPWADGEDPIGKEGYFEDNNERNFIIFEGVLPNPNPECELAGCVPVMEFWQNLTYEDDVGVRADLLDQFYFEGTCGFEPVVTPEHYGLDCRSGGGYGGGCGQIRTNQFYNERYWNLREFKLERFDSELLVKQTTVAQNPHVSVWQKTSPHYPAFTTDLTGQMSRNMPVPDGVNFIAAATSPKFDAGESIATFGGFNFNQYDADAGLEAAIQPFLLPSPSTVTEFDIEERMTTQSCGGCHELSNHVPLGHTQGAPDVIWPASRGFVHIDEFANLSPGMLNHFLPHREQVMAEFLKASCGSGCFPEEGVKLIKEVPIETDEPVDTGETGTPDEPPRDTGKPDDNPDQPILTPVRFKFITIEEYERIVPELPDYDTLSGSLVH